MNGLAFAEGSPNHLLHNYSVLKIPAITVGPRHLPISAGYALSLRRRGEHVRTTVAVVTTCMLETVPPNSRWTFTAQHRTRGHDRVAHDPIVVIANNPLFGG